MKKNYVALSLLLLLTGLIQASELATKELHVVYSDNYNITLAGIEKFHNFDSTKYGKIFEIIKPFCDLIVGVVVHHPKQAIEDKELLEVHTKEYLDSLGNSSVIAEIAEMDGLKLIPNFLLQWRMLTPMRWGTQGTLEAVFLALKHGFAINLSGGYHHAKNGNGEGYCYFADIPLAIKKVHDKYPDHKVLIVDLDVHQGNGHEMLCGENDNVFIFDVYNTKIYPCDEDAKKFIDYDFPIEPGIKDPMYMEEVPGIKDKEYLDLLKEHLPKAVEETKPNLIIFNAGTDIYKDDIEGRMSITKQGIIDRDAFVFGIAKKSDISLLMLPSGGYTKESASIVGDSIKNLILNVLAFNKK